MNPFKVSVPMQDLKTRNAVMSILLAPPKPTRVVFTPTAKFCCNCGVVLPDLPATFKGKHPLCKPCLYDRKLMQNYGVSTIAELEEVISMQANSIDDEDEEAMYFESLDTDGMAIHVLTALEGRQEGDEDLPAPADGFVIDRLTAHYASAHFVC